MPSRSQQKHEAKMSAQLSQIRDLHSKLDTAIMENSQMWEFLNPSTLSPIVIITVIMVQVQGKASLSWVGPETSAVSLEGWHH